MIQDLADRHPAIKALLHEHIADNDELLSHVFFGDVVRWSEAEPRGSVELKQVLDELDVCFRDGNDDVRNVIGASYIEPLWDRPDILMAMGPVLRRTMVWKHMVWPRHR